MEHESQAMMLCEITEKKKRAIEDRVMLEDDKRNLARMSNIQMDTLGQLMNLHHELNMKDIEISTLRVQNEQLQNELKREKETIENLNKSSEAIKYFEQLLKSPRSAHETLGLGYTSTKVGESSKSAKKRKRAVEDRVMLEDDKRNIANKLEEKCTKLTSISNMQMDTLAQLMNLHHELNMKYIETSTLRMQNEQLKNELKREKETAENLNKSSEAIKYFERLLKSPRSAHDTSGLGYTNTEVGESSKNTEQRNKKGKDSKPTCHYCNKKGHTANVCRSRRINQQSIPKGKGYCHKCNMQGHMTQD